MTYQETEPLIKQVCQEIEELLLHKNRMYGNAALEPVNVFSKASPEDYLNQQIDLKLSRIKNQQPDEREDSERDLIGYLILKQVNKKIGIEKRVEAIESKLPTGLLRRLAEQANRAFPSVQQPPINSCTGNCGTCDCFNKPEQQIRYPTKL